MKAITILFYSALLLLSSLRSFGIEPPQSSESKAEEMRKRDSRHTGIMSRGTYGGPISWDRKTIIVTLDGRVVVEQIYSPNKKYYAKADLAAGKTTVFGMIPYGKHHRQVEHWSMDGCHEMLGLSNDGNRLVTGCRTEERAIPGSDPDLAILTIFENGKVIREVRLEELLPDGEEMPDLDSLDVWGRYRRLNPAGYYIIETIGNELVLFDVENGEMAYVALSEKGDLENWRRHVDVYNWFELQYPGDCNFEMSRDFEGYPTGGVSLGRREVGWGVRADMESFGNYITDRGDRSSFVEFAIRMAEIMNSADGPSSSVYVDSIISQTEYANPHGIEVVELSLSIVRAEWNDEKEIKERRIRSQYAALLTPMPGGPRRALILRLSYGSEEQVGSDDTLKRIVQTIRYPE